MRVVVRLRSGFEFDTSNGTMYVTFKNGWNLLEKMNIVDMDQSSVFFTYWYSENETKYEAIAPDCKTHFNGSAVEGISIFAI